MASKQKRVQLSTAQVKEILEKEERPVTIDLKNSRPSKKGPTFYTVLIKHNGTYSPFTWKEINVELPKTVLSKEQQEARPKVFNSCDITLRRSTMGGINKDSPLGATMEQLLTLLRVELKALLKLKKDGLVSPNKEIKLPLQTVYLDDNKEEKPLEDPNVRITLAFPKGSGANGLIDHDVKPRFTENYKMLNEAGKKVPIMVPKEVAADESEDAKKETTELEPLMFGNIHRVFMRTSKMNMVMNITVSTSNLGVSAKFNFSSLEIRIRKPPAADRFTEDETNCLIDEPEETHKGGTAEDGEEDDLTF